MNKHELTLTSVHYYFTIPNAVINGRKWYLIVKSFPQMQPSVCEIRFAYNLQLPNRVYLNMKFKK